MAETTETAQTSAEQQRKRVLADQVHPPGRPADRRRRASVKRKPLMGDLFVDRDCPLRCSRHRCAFTSHRAHRFASPACCARRRSRSSAALTSGSESFSQKPHAISLLAASFSLPGARPTGSSSMWKW